MKDRFAAGIIEWAEKHGQLRPGSGQTVVEASSGNTGIGLAMVCASKGYPFICVMNESYSIERRKLMRFYGAQVILTPRDQNATGMILKAKALAEEHGFFFACKCVVFLMIIFELPSCCRPNILTLPFAVYHSSIRI